MVEDSGQLREVAGDACVAGARRRVGRSRRAQAGGTRWLAVAVLVGALAPLALPRSAAAQSAVVLPIVVGDADLPFEERGQVRTHVAAALQNAELTVHPDPVPPDYVECGEGECVEALRSELDADLAVSVALRAAAGGAEVLVTLVDAQGQVFVGRAPLGDDRAGAASAAVEQALGRLADGTGPFLAVSGTPGGATVEIDGQAVGELPFQGHVDPGEHEVRVSHGGHASQTHRVRIPTDPSATETLEVALVAEGDASLGWAVSVGAGLLAAGALAALVPPIVSAVVTGCIEARASSCVSFDRFAVGENVAWIVVGGAAAVAGLVLVIVGASSASGAAVEARVGPGSVIVRGRF